MVKTDWNLQNIPPAGNPDVSEFAYNLFEIARTEKERLGKNQDFLSNYALYRGKRNRQRTGYKGYSPAAISNIINLYFANVERTISNITARVPTGEVVDMDGIHDDAENILSMQLKKWWKDTDQQNLTKESAREMELYGITIEKPSWNKTARSPAIAVVDPFAFFPAPGNWSGSELSTKTPYICYAYIEFVSEMENFYNVKDIAPDEAYDLLGSGREEYKTQTRAHQLIGNYANPMTGKTSSDKKIERCLVIEVWIRDNRTTTETTTEPVLDEMGEPVIDEKGDPLIKEIKRTVPVYRDGVRKITVTKSKDPHNKNGYVVLDDCANPNINPAAPDDIARNTYPWGKLPCYYANSYKDGVSLWGFAAAEQVGDLLGVINQIIRKLIAYVLNVIVPPLIVQKGCGITPEMIENSIQKGGRLILTPSIPNARIEFMQIPNLPATFFEVLNLLIRFFDRTYQIEDADRGVVPPRITAAAAIIALQERNQVLMQTKTSSIDSLVENRSKWAIGLWQNHGVNEEFVDVADEAKPFVGVNYAGRKFSFIVEAGSTTPRTNLQLQEMAKWLYQIRAISQKGLLEALNWPGYLEELERTAESQADQALQILIDAGLPEKAAMQIKQYIMQSSLQTTNRGRTAPPAEPASNEPEEFPAV